MSANVGYSTLDLIPNAKGFSSALGSGIGGATLGPLKDAGFGGGTLLGAGLLRAVGPLALASAAAFAIGKTAAFLKGAVSSAADLEQSEGAVSAIFKGSSEQILAASKSAASSLGIARNDYDELATVLGAQLRNGGTAADAVAGQTTKLIGLGADLSALFGGSTQTAVSALSSALKGERDPIERYGVSLNQAAVDAKAAELGFQKVGGSLSTEANQAATLALIMDQTADAHGAFGRETDTLANKQQRLAAMWQDGSAAIGAALLPAVSAFASGLITFGGPAIDSVVALAVATSDAATDLLHTKPGDLPSFIPPDVGSALSPIVAAIIGAGGAVLGAFAPAIPQISAALGQLLPALASVLPSLSPVGIVLAGLGPVLPQIIPLVVELATALGPQLVAVHALFVPLVAALGDLMRNQLAAMLPFLVQAVGIVVGLFSVTGPAFLSFVAAVLPLIAAVVAQLMPQLVQLVAAVQSVLVVVASLIVALAPLVTVLLGVLASAVRSLMPVLQAAAALVISVVTAALRVVQGVIEVATGLLTGDWSKVWSGIGTILSGAWALIAGIVRGAVSLIVAVVRAGLSNIGRLFAAAWNGVPAIFTSLTDGLRRSVERGAVGVFDFLRTLGSTVTSGLSGAGTWLVSVGRNIVEGLLGGVQAMAERIKDAVLGPIKDSVEAVKDFLGIHSPSQVMREHGASTVSAAVRQGLEWVPTSEIDRTAPRSFVESVEDGLRRRSGSDELSFELESTGNVHADLEAVDWLLRTQRALQPV